jgi:catechol 2,3-dioxygenase-like lactoylglutathione lyase family enzyme
MAISGIDHVAFPTEDMDRFLAFYKMLGFGVEHEQSWREGRSPVVAVTCGDTKLNIHPPGLAERITLRGPTAQPGCADLCFVWDEGMDALLAMLQRCDVPVIEGPAKRIGGRSAGTARGMSVYIRDPDQNLLEFICY